MHLGAAALAILAALASSAVAAAQDTKRLTEAEITAVVAGNTLSGPDKAGCTFYDYYGADGSAASRCGDASDIGRWETISDGRLCLVWAKRQGLDCIELFARGDELLSRDPAVGGDLRPVSVLKGDGRR